MNDIAATTIGRDLLACSKCLGPLAGGPPQVRCSACGSAFAVDEGVLCTNRTDVFMGEFDAARMMGFVRDAREHGWRHTVNESMLRVSPRAAKVLLSPERASFVDLLDPPGRKSVLDMGAGMGAVSLQLAKSFDQVYALDQTFERLAFLQVIAEQERASIQTICHRDVFRLPFQEASLDAVVMVGVFEYFAASYPGRSIAEVQRGALAELHRVLVPNGVLFIATKNRFGWPNFAGGVDNSGLRFGSLMPRPMANLVSRTLLGKPYRTVTDSYWRYERLVKNAGFATPRFYWPVQGYQASPTWVPVDDRRAMAANVRDGRTALRRGLLGPAASAGLLKLIIPHFGIVARKPG